MTRDQKCDTVAVQVWICGARGSTPAPGEDFLRYGGHTSCVAIAHEEELPSLILDAGTGIRRASDLFGWGKGLVGDNPYTGSILFGHLHWDHTQGLPFFGAGNCPGSQVDVYIPAQGDTKEVLGHFMAPPSFPITPEELRGSWTFHALEVGETKIAGFSVLALEIPHLGGRTFGYRISDGQSTVTYLSDHCPTTLGPGPEGLGDYHQAALELTAGCDLLLHDAQYTDDELPERASFGHASAGYAVGLATASSVGQLLLFHHDPARTDSEIDAIVAKYQDAPFPVSAAAEGMVINL